MAVQGLQLETDTWPIDRLGDLIENLASKAGLSAKGTPLPQPAESFSSGEDAKITRWIDIAASYLGLEAEALDAYYSEVEAMIRSGGPLIIQLPVTSNTTGPRLVALLRSNRRRVSILCPDLRVRRKKPEALRSALCAPFEAPLAKDIDNLLADVDVPQERRQRARKAILGEQLGAIRIPVGWLLRLSPRARITSQMRHGGVFTPFLILVSLHFVQQVISILSWIVIGRGIFQGNFDIAWLAAWVILLFTAIPLQLIVSDGQGELSISAGTLFKQRLLYGILKLEPEEIRHQGMGQFLGRVMESEAVEMLALSGGFTAFLSLIDLALAGYILTQGAGGALQAVVLGIWFVITLLLLWRYYTASQEWSRSFRQMTNDLVENMVGHRTRLAQEDPVTWHEREDQSLDQYLALSGRMDGIGIQLNSVVSRGWILLGLLGIAYPFITGSASVQALAISLGGVLFASQAFSRLVNGSQSLTALLIAWRQVGPLFNAANRQDESPALDFVSFQPQSAHGSSLEVVASSPEDGRQSLLIARDLQYRYRPIGKPVIQDVSLEIRQGERILLEGPSGGGKTTLAALLTGLRKPESGSLLLWGFDRQIVGSQEWRRRVAMAPQFQENFVFTETFGFNLLMGR
ncbi:MAG: ATP-binding cassette domain-containing protein, partial [Anaerolineales bacterium]